MLKVNQITKTYGDLKANDNVSIEIEENSVALLVGPNGAGKSTLLKCIMGLLRYTARLRSGDKGINQLRQNGLWVMFRKYRTCILC